MDNLNDTALTAESLDLSGIPGIEEYLPGSAKAEEPALEEAIDTSDYTEVSEDAGTEGPISWSKFSEDLPEPLHEQFKPIVDEWSRQYERVAEEAAPYYQLRESGFTPEEIQMAAQLQRALAENPEEFYRQMGEAYGYAQRQQLQELQQQVQELRQPGAKESTGNWWEEDETAAPAAAAPVSDDPRYAQLEAELEQLRGIQEQVLERQRLEEGRAQMEIELTNIRTKYGEFDEEEVVRRALANHGQSGDASLTRAFHELKDYEAKIAERFAAKQRQAPKVMGSANGMPAATPPAPLDTEDARRQAALELALRMGASQ